MALAATGTLLLALLLGWAGCGRERQPVTGEQAVSRKPWQVDLPGDEVITLNWVPPGTFLRGSAANDPLRGEDEGPVRTVRIAQGFWLGTTEVTIGQWRAVMATSVREHLAGLQRDRTRQNFAGRASTLSEYMGWDPAAPPESYLASEDDDRPMYFVSWHDARAFCVALTEREQDRGNLPADHQFSLPTEAQWEYACRAPGSTGISRGDAAEVPLGTVAWYAENSPTDYTGKMLPGTRAGPRTVATRMPNSWGLHDLQGNLWEWCLDWYGPYPDRDDIDPRGPDTGVLRVNRGGSWGSAARDQRPATRAGNPPAEASAYRGFRVALVPSRAM